MFSGTKKDYRIAELTQEEMLRNAEQYRLAQLAPDTGADPIMNAGALLQRKWVLRGLAIALVLAIILIGAGQALAGGPSPVVRDAGDAEPFGEALASYREGCYYLNHGEYEQAIIKLNEAIDGLPDEVFTQPGYMDMYWLLGEAQEGAGLYSDALTNYRQFLDLAGEIASPWAINKADELERDINALLVAVAQVSAQE